MTQEELIAFWREEYGVLPGEQLPEMAGRWARLHYLPGGEQYARHRGQYCEMLRRLNAVLDYVLGEGREYVLIVTEWGANDIAPTNLDLGPFRLLREVWRTDDLAQESPVLVAKLHFLDLAWQTGSQDVVLRKVADEEISGVSFLSTAGRWLAVPYDGGIDVLAPDEEQRQSFQDEFRDWAPFAGEIDEHEVARVAHPDERPIVQHLVDLDASIYLNENDRTYLLKICSSRTDDAVIAQITKLSSLEYLHIFPWKNDVPASPITDDGLALLEELTALRFLNLPADDRDTFPYLTERGRSMVKEIEGRMEEFD